MKRVLTQNARRWFTIVSACAISAGCSVPAGAKPGGYAGVYSTTPEMRIQGREIVVDDVIRAAASGVLIRIAWDVLEPQAGKYDWSRFDAIALPAIRANKNLSIGVIAGPYAPDWIGDVEGAKYSMFTIEQIGCRQARIYWPWDRTYQQAYVSLLRALKTHLNEIGGYDSLKIVKNSYISAQTLELRLPHRAPGVYKGCRIGDLDADWVKAGYRPALVLESYRRVMSALANTVFPDKLISQPTQRSGSFPSIDDSGQRVRRGVADVPLLQAIIDSCISIAERRCAIQNQSLQTVGPVGDRVVAAREHGATIGWQSAIFQRRSRCVIDTGKPVLRGMRKLPATACSKEQYRSLLRRGLDAGATYLELWPQDIRAYPDVIRDADARMRAAAARAG